MTANNEWHIVNYNESYKKEFKNNSLNSIFNQLILYTSFPTTYNLSSSFLLTISSTKLKYEQWTFVCEWRNL